MSCSDGYPPLQDPPNVDVDVDVDKMLAVTLCAMLSFGRVGHLWLVCDFTFRVGCMTCAL